MTPDSASYPVGDRLTPERPFTDDELQEVLGILRNQDSILGLRLVVP